MRRSIVSTLSALVLIGAVSPAVAATQPAHSTSAGDTVVNSGALLDLQPQTANPTDGASAALVATTTGESARHHLVVWNLDASSAGRTFGVHVHVGSCVPGNGDAAGPHYNTGGPPSPTTEVWLDFTATNAGTAWSQATTPFAIPTGQANALVIHDKPTAPDGDAGDRIACLPAPY